MGLFDRFKAGLKKTQSRLAHEIKRIVTLSPKLTEGSIEDLETALLAADLGLATSSQIVDAVRRAYETQGRGGIDVFGVASSVIASNLSQSNPRLARSSGPLTIVSIVGVNGTGKTTSCAKLAALLTRNGDRPLLAACDTFRAAAIEQLKIWGQRLDVPVIASNYGADPAAVAHDAVSAALSRKATHVLIDTAGRLHTKQNLMQELQKLHRVLGKQSPGAPHEVLLVLDANTGMNTLNQAHEFHKTVKLTGLIVTKLDGTSKGGMVVAVQNELQLPVKFIGLGEQPEDLQPFDPQQFASALFSREED